MMVSFAASASIVDRVLVIVNDDVITQSEYSYRKQLLTSEYQGAGRALPDDLDNQLLEGMIADRLQVQEAERRGLAITDEELNDSLRRFATQQNLDVLQLSQLIEGRGQSFTHFKESMRDSLTISRLSEYYARARVEVPDYEIDGFIEQNQMSDAGAEYQIAHILIKNPLQNRPLAERVLAELRAGQSFQQAVLNYSEATDAQEGGVIGWRRLNQLPELYAEAIRGIQVGEVTNVLESDNGLHILKLVDLRGQREEIMQTQVRHILIGADTQVAKKQATKKMTALRDRIVAGEEFSDLARIYSDDSVSAANGGELGWVSPGETVPNFENTFEQLALNELSQPIETEYGVHLIQVLDRRQQNVTEQVIRNQVDGILRRQRAEREFEQWVRGLKDQAYIEYVSAPST